MAVASMCTRWAVILSGPKKKDFVVLTLAQFNAMEETAHLLSTSANTERLMRAMSQDRAGKVRGRGYRWFESLQKEKSDKQAFKITLVCL